MDKYIIHFYRAFTIVAALFFFITCAGKTKPWKFNDIQSLDVRVLDTQEWLLKTKKNLQNLNKIMRPQLAYYLKKDFRIYEKLDVPFDNIKTNVRFIDSTHKSMTRLIGKMKKTSSDSLDDIPEDTTVSYRRLFNDSRERIKKSKNKYYKNIKKLKKAFKPTKQVLFFIEEECTIYKNSIYDLQYRRKMEQANIDRFNKKLNKALFNDSETFYSKRIIDISKKLESYRIKLDSFEYFLLNMEDLLIKEMGGTVVLIPKKKMPPKFVDKYEKEKKEYVEILKDIRNIVESI